MRLAPLLAAVAATSLAAWSAEAAEVAGRVVFADDGSPAAGVRVVAPECDGEAWTAEDGTFAIAVGDLPEVTLVPLLEGDSVEDAIRWVHQTPDRGALLRVFRPVAPPPGGFPWGGPIPDRPQDPAAPPREPVRIGSIFSGGPLGLTLPTAFPTAIRVGRRFADTCSGHPVQRIDTVPLEEYAEGVLLPEIGVFRAVEGGPDSAAAVFEAFAVAARSYALWFYFRDPDAAYHLDDTACNQRYDDARAAWVADRVAATESELLVQTSDPTVLEKFEYAASCGRHGTLPEFQETTVPDDTEAHACVGSWCGHDGCAGHQVNPEFPDAGRCLVRGICQWGAVERSMTGADYLDILDHYQPNLTVVAIPGSVDPADPADTGAPDVADADTGIADTGVADAGDDSGAADTGAPGGADAPDADLEPDPGPSDAGPSDASARRPPALYSLVASDAPVTRGCSAAPVAGQWPSWLVVPMVACLVRRPKRRRTAPDR